MMSLSAVKDKIVNNKKIVLCLLALIVVGILWKLYPRMLVPRMFPSDEYINIGYVLWLTQHGGNPYDAFHNPHLGYFLVYFINVVFKFDIYQIMFVINPIISGLAVIPFFFFALKLLNNKNQALIASILFTFSETVFYRTCHYGSNEVLGLFLMFSYLVIYLHATRLRYKLLSLSVLITIPFAHVLPFVFAIVFTFSDLLIKKKKLLILCLVVGSVLLVFNPIFPPHRFVVSEVPVELSSLSIDKLFLYNMSDITENILFLMGLVGMLFLSIFSFKQAFKIEKIVLICMFVGILLSLLLYGVRLIGPTRLLVYISIPLFTMTARILDKKKIIVAILVVLMVASPLIGGTDRFVWLSDAITADEIEVVDFLIDKGVITSADTCFADSVVKQYISLSCGGTTYLSSKQWFYQYVFLSKRMEHQALFLKLQKNGRTLEIRESVNDLWATNQSNWKENYFNHGINLLGWKLLYNIKGVKVYEAVYEVA